MAKKPGPDAASNRLCDIPFAGDLLFGSELESILEQPIENSFQSNKCAGIFLHTQKGQQEDNSEHKGRSGHSSILLRLPIKKKLQ